MSLTLRALDRVSLAGGVINDDRVGAAGDLAWAIDGATDVLDEPLIAGGSDAAWLAGVLDGTLAELADKPPPSPLDLVHTLTSTAARRFTAEQRRAPAAPFEQPSAAALIVCLRGEELEFVSLADCQCLVRRPGEVTVAIGADAEVTQGDRRVIEVMQTIRADSNAGWREARASVWPRIRAARARLNTPEGYGVLSIIPPPDKFVRTGRMPVVAGTTLLLATDGFMRLVDLFGRYSSDEMVEIALRQGLPALADELREMERADGECVHVPRTKPHDDASAILVGIA
ncbi:MAG: protein phosphatase 2C domain-containing protein [Hyphomicrobiaceae bacterium]